MARTKETSNRKATEPEDELTARHRIRRLVGRASEKARENKEKGKAGPICLTFDEARRGVFICKGDDTGQVLYK